MRGLGVCLLLTSLRTANSDPIRKVFTELNDVYNGPVALDFLTPDTVVVSERTKLSLLDLETRVRTELLGSSTIGGYVDGEKEIARFSYINDVVVQGNYMYIADYSCIRIYDIERKKVATLAGVCGRMEELDPHSSTAAPAFRGHLKLAVSARELYVLDGHTVSRVDRETGVVWALSTSQKLSEGHATSIEIDRYSNTLFVAVARPSEIDIIAIDIASGKQTLYSTINTSMKDKQVTAIVASLDVAPDGTIFVLEPNGLHTIERDTTDVTTEVLSNYGYHEIAISSKYLVISQEFYSRMYKVHLMEMGQKFQQTVTNNETEHSTQPVATEAKEENPKSLSLQTFESKIFYLAIVFPSILFLLVILVVVCATRKIIKKKTERRYQRPASDSSSEKYFLSPEGNVQEANYWM